ncbi:MAG TPA: hypothetical protein VFC82_02250, partial [Actinomycetaceae bacterium]|nr:hypothetical protein [Actinomycetaceae bacterium]
ATGPPGRRAQPTRPADEPRTKTRATILRKAVTNTSHTTRIPTHAPRAMPEEQAEAVVWLLSDAASYVAGSASARTVIRGRR